jgi:eukaryotic-like serine/threonine-protein kinase
MADRSGEQIDRYHLIRLLGQGQFGDVYLAENVYRKTQVAIKVLNIRLTPEEMPMFLNEARNIRLKHPHIVSILDFGIESTSGIPFLVMDYAPHGTVRHQHPRGIQIPLATVVHYARQIAAALQYAHEEHLVHRDVKPENMLIGQQQELLLSDFGVSVVFQTGRTTVSTTPQQSQGVGGTPCYMAPEQFRAKPSPASDQYALGIVVYEWLCGTPPFAEGDFIQLGYLHNFEPPPSLCGKVPTLSPEVEQVVMKALAKNPQERFSSVLAFAEALEQISQVRIITGRLSNTQKLSIRTIPLGTLLCTYRGHAAGVLTVTWSPDGTRVASGSDASSVQVWNAATGEPLFTYRGHSSAVYAVAWSRDEISIISGSADNTVQVWEAATGQLFSTYRGHSSSVLAVAESPNEARIASGSADQTIQIWEAATGQLFATYHGHANAVNTISWSSNGTLIASGSDDKAVQVWEAATGRLLHTYTGHGDLVNAVAWSPDGSCIASGSDDNTVQVWEAATGRLLHVYRGHSSIVYAVAWSPGGASIASGSDDNTVQVWDVATGRLLHIYKGHTSGVYAVAWSPDGTRIASGSWDKTVQVWQAG